MIKKYEGTELFLRLYNELSRNAKHYVMTICKLKHETNCFF